jgi:hypothetical protein
MADLPCPACTRTRAPGHYLCRPCWGGLNPDARSQLNRRDGAAIDRLRQLLDQIQSRVPLAHINITTPPKD